MIAMVIIAIVIIAIVPIATKARPPEPRGAGAAGDLRRRGAPNLPTKTIPTKIR